MGELGYQLKGGRCHLDPDLRAETQPRIKGWRGLFGQVGAAASHLDNQDVGVGDLFLFFGLYRHTVLSDGKLRFKGPALHCLYGYLEVEMIIPIDEEAPDWAAGHPHLAERYKDTNSRLYVARERLSFAHRLPGFGSFGFDEALQLTAAGGGGLTDWLLDESFSPGSGGALSYHNDKDRWGAVEDGKVSLQAVARGQEFVAQGEAAYRWAQQLVCDHTIEVGLPDQTTDRAKTAADHNLDLGYQGMDLD